MKAISLWQPWASLIAGGHKAIETRSWTTTYRGPLAIHATRKTSPVIRETCQHWPFSLYIGDLYDHLPRGCVLATAYLYDCIKIVDPYRGPQCLDRTYEYDSIQSRKDLRIEPLVGRGGRSQREGLNR